MKPRLPKIGTKVRLKVTLPKAEFAGHILQPLVCKGTIGEVTAISYPIRGGVPEPTVHVTFPYNGFKMSKPLESCVSGIPMTFSDWFERV